ncbi:helix-turn-helix transcriptional regulator [Porticoccus sp. W117]|uniref:helix-turn-helix domain-containing protein n=1 Tax=Porticoccus sp. W117 TaxID=3054777 RepID=UPI002594BA67|nr:helix-turn-helix transcriptional regulator [Porticoccus sp. W117]MDM3872249.1 helix-turn-helix transcriptional regulator [Porticoccus sp. W117]MDM3872255.1 helix-turn-helix transcriptional regulator [Porticoccus sp. W117]
MALLTQWTDAMMSQENTFYIAMGKRIAQFRKAQNMTQTQLADALGIAQQTMAHYEGGKLRIPVGLLSMLATLLAVSVEEIIGEPTTAKGKRGPTPRLQRQMELIGQLPRAKQKFVMEMLDTVIQQQAS